MKLMAGSYHEIAKEPNNKVAFESILNFMEKRLTEGVKAFGKIDIRKDIKFDKNRPAYVKKRFWYMMAVIYLFIGLVYAVIRRRPKLFLSWPSMLVLAKRLK